MLAVFASYFCFVVYVVAVAVVVADVVVVVAVAVAVVAVAVAVAVVVVIEIPHSWFSFLCFLRIVPIFDVSLLCCCRWRCCLFVFRLCFSVVVVVVGVVLWF